MKAIKLTEKELYDIIHESFKAGENWAITYQTWFEPTEHDTKTKVEALYRKFSRK